MKLKLTLITGLFLMLFTINAFAAPSRAQKNDIGFNVSGALQTADDVDSGLFLGGNWSYGITDWFAMGAEAGWAQFSIDQTESAGGVTAFIDGDFTAVPVLADFIFRAPNVHEQLVPYAVVGIGVVFWDFDGSAGGTSGSTTVDADVSVDAAFAMKFGGGVDWYVNENWIVYFEGAYYWTEPDVNVSVSGASTSDNEDMSFWNIGGGLKFVF